MDLFQQLSLIIYIYDYKKNIQLKINKECTRINYFDQYIIISYNIKNERNVKFYIEVYSLQRLTVIQTLEVEYFIEKIMKLNNNLFIATERYGNILVFNIAKDFIITKKEIFRAHDYGVIYLSKFDDNKSL